MNDTQLAAALHRAARALDDAAAAIMPQRDNPAAGNRNARLAAVLEQLDVPREQAPDTTRMSALLREHGFAPQQSGALSLQGVIRRETWEADGARHDRRVLTDLGREKLRELRG